MSLIVFLDLPAPWDAVEHAKKALRVCIAPPFFSFDIADGLFLRGRPLFFSDALISLYFPSKTPYSRLFRKIVTPEFVASVRALNKSFGP